MVNMGVMEMIRSHDFWHYRNVSVCTYVHV